MAFFDFEGHRLAYTEHGDGGRAFILIHGQLLSQYMQTPLAEALAARGHRVITVDLLGHGASDRPTEISDYSMSRFAEQVVALLDHLRLERAVVGGTSLGANVSLEFAVIAPERAQALMVEMPVLETGAYGAVMAFTPLLTVMMYARGLVDAFGFAARLIPRAPLPFLANVVLDTMRQDHRASPAILQGLFLGRIAPSRQLRERMRMPVLVIGHHNDPIHPFADAEALATELPDGRLVEANSIFELRLHPDRLTEEIGQFLDDCWEEPPRAKRGAVRLDGEARRPRQAATLRVRRRGRSSAASPARAGHRGLRSGSRD